MLKFVHQTSLRFVSKIVLQEARWSGNTRNWTPVGAVTLNPERDTIVKTHLASNNIQPLAA
jgi:tRNA(Arg) A34 adenosine deaminase TadA